jgi:uncharacterized damage-inducible protein DinB
MEDLRYPIGKYERQTFSEVLWKEWLRDIQFLPQHLENAILDLDKGQLETPYREGGWTIHQVVHHVADSHMNAYIRFKLGLTEDNPTIKPYDEAQWAVMEDTMTLPVNISLTILHAMHTRWTVILKSMKREELDRTVYHPEYKKEFTLWDLLGLYAWHSKHHVAHIMKLRERKNW